MSGRWEAQFENGRLSSGTTPPGVREHVEGPEAAVRLIQEDFTGLVQLILTSEDKTEEDQSSPE